MSNTLEQGIETEQELKKKLQVAISFLDCAPKVLAAVHFIEKIQKTSSIKGDNSFADALAVAEILTSMSVEVDTIIAGLFYTFQLYNKAPIKEVVSHFGDEVVYLINKLNTIAQIKFKTTSPIKKECLDKLIEVADGDTRVFIIKLADRLHTMRSLAVLPSHSQKEQIAKETMHTYVPMSERVGMQVVKNELQELSFAILNPIVRNSIVLRLNAFRKGCGQLIPMIIKSLKEAMEQSNIDAKVFGREKTPYSILEKMKRKNISFRQISDIMAFRILVNDLNLCYLALGAIHTRYQNIPGHFKDFISAPKENNYRSLHTIVMGPDQKIMEVQIRTYEMQNFAEYGLAAHECYKKQHEYKGRDIYKHTQSVFELHEPAFDDNIEKSNSRFMEENYGLLQKENMKFTYNTLSQSANYKTLQDYSYNSELWTGSSVMLGTHSTIRFTLENAPGALAAVTKEIANYKVTIDNIKTLKRSEKFSEIRLDLTTKDSSQLAILLDALKNKRYISSVSTFN